MLLNKKHEDLNFCVLNGDTSMILTNTEIIRFIKYNALFEVINNIIYTYLLI